MGLDAVLQLHGLDKDRCFDGIDADKSGFIAFDEFLRFYEVRPDLASPRVPPLSHSL